MILWSLIIPISRYITTWSYLRPALKSARNKRKSEQEDANSELPAPKVPKSKAKSKAKAKSGKWRQTSPNGVFSNSEMSCLGSISQPFQACGCTGVNPEHAHLGLAWIPWKKNCPRIVQQILSMQCSMPGKTHPWPSHCFCRSHCHRINALAVPGVVGPMGTHAASCIANGAGGPRWKRWKKTMNHIWTLWTNHHSGAVAQTTNKQIK